VVIKFSLVVAAIDQLISMLSIPSVQNLARKGMEFGLEKSPYNNVSPFNAHQEKE
jgi:hypothetical protein